MSRIFYGGIALSIVMGLILGACATGSDGTVENTPEEMDAVHRVLDQLKNSLGEAYPTGLAHFEMGTLDEGCAVLLVHVNHEPVNAAFWTQDETVYAVNNAARTMNRALADAPEAISEDRVRAVVD